MNKRQRLSFLIFIWALMGAGVVGISCGGSGGCPPGQEPISNIKFGTTADPGCAFTCLGDGDCPEGEFCEENLSIASTCEPCSAASGPEDCDSNSDCPGGGTCLGCQCTGGNGSGCATVDVPAGSVPFGGACDQNEDCADGLPCIDCVCI